MFTPGGLILVALAALAGPGAAPAPSFVPAEPHAGALALQPPALDVHLDRDLLAVALASATPPQAAAWHGVAPPRFRPPDPALAAFLLAGLLLKSRGRLRAATARPPAE